MNPLARLAVILAGVASAWTARAQPLPPNGQLPADQFLPPSLNADGDGKGDGDGSSGPRLTPTRDVTIQYRSGKAGASATGPLATEYISVRQGLKRLDQGPRYWIVNTETRKVAVVAPQARLYFATSGAREMTALFPAGSTFKRQGERQIAGLACTIWLMTAADGFEAQACYTSDGVMLAVNDGERWTEATNVTYGELSSDLFRFPPDWRSVDLPPLTPTRDVEFKSHAMIMAPPFVDFVEHFSFPLSRLRTDFTKAEGYRLSDLKTGVDIEVHPERKSYMPSTSSDKLRVGWSYGWPLALAQRGAVFERGQPETIAGLPCTNWKITQKEQPAMAVCIGDDGLMLRFVSSERTFEILSANYGPQPLSSFLIPDGYRDETPMLGK